MRALIGLVMCLVCGCTSPRPDSPDPSARSRIPTEPRAGSAAEAGAVRTGSSRCPPAAATRTTAELLAMPLDCFTEVEDIVAFWAIDTTVQFAPYASAAEALTAGFELIKVLQARGAAGHAAFVSHLGSDSSGVRRACVLGLSSFQDPADLPLLVARLTDVSALVRTAAIGALSMYGTKVPLETIRAAFTTETEWDPFYAAFETLKLRGDTDFMIDTLRLRLATPQRSETIKRLALLKPSPRVAGILLAELKRNLAKQTGYETVSRHVGKEVDGHFERRWILTPSDNEDLVNALVELADPAALPLLQQMLTITDEKRGMTAYNIAVAIHTLTGKPVRYREHGVDSVYPPMMP